MLSKQEMQHKMLFAVCCNQDDTRNCTLFLSDMFKNDDELKLKVSDIIDYVRSKYDLEGMVKL